jgi:hypothetical protein
MTPEILNKIAELNEVSNWIYTNQLVKELKNFENSENIVNILIDNDFLLRTIVENFDICSFDTLKMNRLLKLKKLSN